MEMSVLERLRTPILASLFSWDSSLKGRHLNLLSGQQATVTLGSWGLRGGDDRDIISHLIPLYSVRVLLHLPLFLSPQLWAAPAQFSCWLLSLSRSQLSSCHHSFCHIVFLISDKFSSHPSNTDPSSHIMVRLPGVS